MLRIIKKNIRYLFLTKFNKGATSMKSTLMKMHYYEILETVATGSSLSATAKKFGLSQPAISRIINQVEADEGLLLFNRKDNWSLTQAGKLYVEKSRAIREIEKQYRKQVELLTSTSVVNLLLPALEFRLYGEVLRTEFEKLNCDFIFNIELAELANIEDFLLFEENEVNNREFSFAVLVLPKVSTNVDYMPLKRYDFVAVIPKDILEFEDNTKQPFICLEQLSHIPVALPNRGLTIRTNILDMYKKASIKPIISDKSIVYGNGFEVSTETLDNCLVYVQKEYIVNKEMHFNKEQFDIFQIVDGEKVGAYQDAVIAYRKGKAFNEAEQIVLDLLKRVIC